ncbi:hypothetical protein APR48_09760 [Variovorax paradoxus]|nr:hypothetical protein APR49_38325 [Variovorax paradoxus]KPV33595.1 hypothetical protein APR48_09760 [Variovorax paradoxus]KPV37595.1 hypothetical protein APR47_06315 [Variovorax paradoxus]
MGAWSRHVCAHAQAQHFFVGSQPLQYAPRLVFAHAGHAHPPARADRIDVVHQDIERRQARALQPRGQGGMEPSADGVARPRLAHDQVLQPPQRLELMLDEPGPPRDLGAAGAVTLPPCPALPWQRLLPTTCTPCRIGGLIRLQLLRLAEVFQALGSCCGS